MHKQVTAYYGCEIQKERRTGEARPSLTRNKLVCLKEHTVSSLGDALYKGFDLTVMGFSTPKIGLDVY